MLAWPVWSDGVITVGRAIVDGAEVDIKRASIDMSTVGPVTLVAAVTAKKIRVVVIHLSPSLNCELEWRSNTTVLIAAVYCGARAQFGQNYLPGYYVETAAGEALTLRQSNASPALVRGMLDYVEV